VGGRRGGGVGVDDADRPPGPAGGHGDDPPPF
jgi:hypothetical protein